VALLSGGIDSPVAIHLLQSRLEVIAAHFHQMPLTSEKELEKVKVLCRILGVKKLYLIPFAGVLKELVSRCSNKDYFILSKILMFKAAEKIAEKEAAAYLITGENLAQVSSQTLSNLTTITRHLSLPVLRPVLTFDKQEIMDLAKKIETYETSSGPEICCLLGPKHPATKSDAEAIGKELDKIDFKIVEEALQKAEMIGND